MSTKDASATGYPLTSQPPAPPTEPSNPRRTLSSTANEEMDDKSSNAAAALAEAIDDFLGDLERKFKGISSEILTKLDDMAERCDRIETELLLREAAGAGTSKSSLEEKSEG